MGQKEQKIIDITPLIPSEPTTSLMQPDLRLLYSNRSKQLRTLATSHAMKDYLLFAADVADAQSTLLQQQPMVLNQAQEKLLVDWCTAPLSKTTHVRYEYWRIALDALLDIFTKLPQYGNGSGIEKTVTRLRAMDAKTKENLADELLAGNIAATGSDGAVFFWAALSLYWAQLARLQKLEPQETGGVERHLCPVCGSEPVASVITLGPPEGLRYLHCNLCESEWHYVRTQCSNCENSGKLHYWTLDDQDSPIQTESCGDCHSHLKIFHQNKDAGLDPVASDLASLALDALMEEEGFARSTINPFLFPEHSV